MIWNSLILVVVIMCAGCMGQIPRPDMIYVVPTTKWGTLNKKSALRNFIMDFKEDQDFSEIDGGVIIVRYTF